MQFKTKYKAVSAVMLKSLLLILLPCALKAQHTLRISLVDKDTAFNLQPLQIQASFINELDCYAYVMQLPRYLGTKGYPTASVDTVSASTEYTSIRLFLGKQYRWVRLQPDSIERRALDNSRYNAKNFTGKLINMDQLRQVQESLLDYYEDNGYPFASIYLDSIRLEEDRIDALLKAKRGPLYHIDSIRVLGKAKISKSFLEHYLNLPKKTIYSRSKLQQVSKRILELPYLQEIQPSDITMLGSGAVLNLYLAPKRSSQVNFLVGFLPNAGQDGKLQLTADVNLNLKNVLGSGESILLNWQSLQAKSPRLNLGYQHPYIFNSSFGIDFLFDLFKKDSTFLQINAQLGLQYLLSANQSGKLFVQWQNSFLLGAGVDTNVVIATKKLPPNIDVTAINVGIDYDWNKTDYKLNPRKGNELRIIGTVGTKKITRNNDILNIKDPSFNYGTLYDSVKLKSYQFRVKLAAAHYFPLGKQSTIRTAVNAGVFVSPSTFRNELFQIGGYKLLRGFTEESIYASQYGVLTAEFRYRLGLNSYFFAFADGALVKNKYQAVNTNNNFIGGGIGLNFETGFGLLNISYAVGKRDDVKFSLREASKIHFGYINYF